MRVFLAIRIVFDGMNYGEAFPESVWKFGAERSPGYPQDTGQAVNPFHMEEQKEIPAGGYGGKNCQGSEYNRRISVKEKNIRYVRPGLWPLPWRSIN
jgi:hypothetical protein